MCYELGNYVFYSNYDTSHHGIYICHVWVFENPLMLFHPKVGFT